MKQPTSTGILVTYHDRSTYYASLNSIADASEAWIQLPNIPTGIPLATGMVNNDFMIIGSDSGVATSIKWDESTHSWLTLAPPSIIPTFILS